MLNHIIITVELLADYWGDTIGQIAENNRDDRDTQQIPLFMIDICIVFILFCVKLDC